MRYCVTYVSPGRVSIDCVTIQCCDPGYVDYCWAGCFITKKNLDGQSSLSPHPSPERPWRNVLSWAKQEGSPFMIFGDKK